MQSLESWQAAGQYISHHGHDIFYRTEGDKSLPPLLLIHGFPSASWDWHKVWDTLGKRFFLIAPDMIGFGLSDKPQKYAYSILDQADLCQALLSHLGVQDYHILAHDYGDSVAQELLARQSGHILSCVFLNGGLFPESHKPAFVQKLLISPLGALVGKLFTAKKFEDTMKAIFDPEKPPAQDELDILWQLLNHNDGRKIIHKLIYYMAERKKYRSRWVGAMMVEPVKVGPTKMKRVPLRLIDGLTDPISGAHMAARYEELVPDADVVGLDRVGHYPQIEAPEQVLEAFLDFHKNHA